MRETDLLRMTEMVPEEKICLQTYLRFYEEHFCRKFFIYEIEDGSEVLLTFQEENLCHLLGVHHVVKGLRKKSDYEGRQGYEAIRSGHLTVPFLHATNKKGYKSIRRRLRLFPFLYQMVHHPQLVEFTDNGLITRMRFDLLMHYHNDMDSLYMHVGLSKFRRDRNIYFPRSFFEDTEPRYIEGRVQRKVIQVRVESGLPVFEA